MIDIHIHILPGVDDGASDMDEAVEMARISYNDGVRHIIATPHFHRTFVIGRAAVDKGVRELQATLDAKGIGVTIYPGNEVQLIDAEDFYRNMKNKAFYTLGGGTFLLLEQMWSGYNPETPDVFAWLLAQGVTPIIPHPERHVFFRNDPALLDSLIEAGAWTQVSADSLTGRNNEEVRRFALDLVDRNRVHTLATDAHNVNRKPNLSEGYRIVTERAGAERAAEIRRRMEQIVPAGGGNGR